MSNMIKGGYVFVDNEGRKVIDYNDLLNKRLDEQREKLAAMQEPEPYFDDDFAEGIDPVKVAALVSDMDKGEGTSLFSDDPEADGYDDLMFDAEPSKIIKGQVASDEAAIEASLILDRAREESEQIKANAEADGYEKGLKAGYDDGLARAAKEFEEKIDELKADYDRQVADIKAQYEALKQGLEPMLVDKLSHIYEQVIGINLKGDKDALLFLLSHALEDMDSNRSYMIHLSRFDYDNVSARKEELSKAVGIALDSLEFIEDNTLAANGCLIECEGGIFDCSLDTQLTLLSKQLRVLASS